jgi:rhodanese-related sulfurtransferase
MKKLILLLSFLLLSAGLPAIASDVPTMSKEELKAQLNSSTLAILDVRSGRDWSSSEFKITGAVRVLGSEIAKWSKDYKKDQTIVLYCA